MYFVLAAMVLAAVICFANKQVAGTVLHLKASLSGAFILLPIIIFILYKQEDNG